MKPKIAVLQFPGSNCEQDVVASLDASGADPFIVFHDSAIDSADGVVLPGGFAHGDYLRTGAIARFSPAMNDVSAMAAAGLAVIGICNGFQILCEAGLLPGGLMKNASLRFICDWTTIEVRDNTTALTCGCEVGEVLTIPINHYEGNFVPSIHTESRKVFTYEHDVNGSFDRIAGISSASGNVVGLMPHPERASFASTGSVDGLRLLSGLIEWCSRVRT